MLLQDVYPIDHIKVGLESADKDELFEELVDYLVMSSGKRLDRSAILAAIREREAKMSTGVKRGIALPHGTVDSLSDTYGVLGISRVGVDYDALDGEPVYLVFLLVSPPNDLERHLRILQRLAVMLDDQAFASTLAGARDAPEACRIVQRFEAILLGKEEEVPRDER